MSEVGGNPPGGSPESSLEHVTATRRLLRRLRGIMAGSASAQERLDRIVRIIAAEMVGSTGSVVGIDNAAPTRRGSSAAIATAYAGRPSTLITRGRLPPVPDNARRRKSLAAVRSRLGDNRKSMVSCVSDASSTSCGDFFSSMCGCISRNVPSLM